MESASWEKAGFEVERVQLPGRRLVSRLSALTKVLKPKKD
jgi:hypothetical protein